MNKGILIIGNPGKGKHYCEGVEKDLLNYRKYFSSITGGAWEDDEIKTLLCPTVTEMNRAVNVLDEMDYSVIVFSGHGYSNINGETIIELSDDGDEYSENILKATNRTVIIDCCRKLWLPPTILEKRADFMNLYESARYSSLRELARLKYEDYIKNSNGMPVVMYSCSLGECANDNSELGGDYSYQLLKAGKRFAGNAGEDALDVVEAHYIAKTELEKLNHTQHPRICRARSGNYYPFAIKLNNVEG